MREAVNVPSNNLFISKFSHWATESGDEYIHLINGTSPIMLTKVKVTVAGHHIDKVVGNLVTATRI